MSAECPMSGLVSGTDSVKHAARKSARKKFKGDDDVHGEGENDEEPSSLSGDEGIASPDGVSTRKRTRVTRAQGKVEGQGANEEAAAENQPALDATRRARARPPRPHAPRMSEDGGEEHVNPEVSFAEAVVHQGSMGEEHPGASAEGPRASAAHGVAAAAAPQPGVSGAGSARGGLQEGTSSKGVVEGASSGGGSHAAVDPPVEGTAEA
eukprot:363203-Chlamydomonas_euryale.AAC.4